MQLAQSINSYLVDQGIKKKYIAEKAKISENALNLALNGKRRLLADEYVKICIALNVPFDKFVTSTSGDDGKAA
jgi:transcriptional regulator with XRE-family HTH domain